MIYKMLVGCGDEYLGFTTCTDYGIIHNGSLLQEITREDMT